MASLNELHFLDIVQILMATGVIPKGFILLDMIDVALDMFSSTVASREDQEEHWTG